MNKNKKLGEINIIVSEDERGNVSYIIHSTNEKGITAYYTRNGAVSHIREQLYRIVEE